MTIKDIQMQSDPVRRAAMIHCRFWHTAAWEKARELRDRLVDEHDPKWPHGRFWDAVDGYSEFDPMAPDYGALAAEPEPVSQINDSRESAGL